MAPISPEFRLGIIMLAVIPLLRNLLGILSSSPSESPRASYAQMRIEISSLRIDINDEICTTPTSTGHVSIIVDPESVPQALITSDTALASDTTSVWPTLDSERFQLDVRPSSRLLFTLHEGRSSKNIRCSFFAPAAELFAGVSDEGSCIYEAYNKDGKLLFRLSMTLALESYPRYSELTLIESSNGLPSDSAPEEPSYRLFHLTQEKRRFADVFSWEVGVVLYRLTAFLHQHGQEIPDLSTAFLRSTMSVFWRITQDLGPHESPSSTDTSPANSPPTTQSSPAPGHWSERRGEVPSGGEYPLRNIVFQMYFLLGMRVPDSGQGRDDLLLAIRRELCLCVAVLDTNIEHYRDITWMKARLADQTPTLVERQHELFLLGCKCALLKQEQELDQYNGSFGDGKQVIEKILKFAVEEGLKREESEYGRPKEGDLRTARPFTYVITSARGSQCDNVWSIAFEMLQVETDREIRIAYRHILVALVQAADRIPSSLWVETASNWGELIVSQEDLLSSWQGAFASVYRSRLNEQDVAIKCFHTLAKSPTNIDERRRAYLEIVSWKTLHHPNLLPFMGICRAKLQSGKILGESCMVSPYMDRGTLRSYYSATAGDVPSDRRPFDLIGRMRHIQQVVSGMVYLHSEGIIHGDLRSDNIFIDSSNNIQIAEFSLCLFSADISCNDYSIRAGNIRWTAPERIAPQYYPADAPQRVSGSDNIALKSPDETMPRPPLSDTFLEIGCSTLASDVFSFSSVCIEVFTGRPPFDEINEAQLRDIIYGGTLGMPRRPMSIESDAFWNLVKACRSNFASERPTFAKIQEALSAEAMALQSFPNDVQSGDVGASHIDMD